MNIQGDHKYMDTVIRKLDGANMDIDLATPEDRIQWQQDKCPWNEAEGRDKHKWTLKELLSFRIPPQTDSIVKGH